MIVGVFLLLVLLGVAVFGVVKNIALPTITLPLKQEIVAPVPSSDPMQELSNKLLERKVSIDFPLVATSAGILAHLVDGGQVFFATNKDFTLQIDSLQLILSRLTIEGKKVKKIDFRFEKPIVVY